MRTFYLLSVWLHILAAAAWIGGMVFLAVVMVPMLRRPEYRGAAVPLLRWTGVRFRPVGWAALGLLVLSGLFQLAYRGFGWADAVGGRLWAGPFGRILAVKLGLVAVVLVVSAVHDFVIGPRATTVGQQKPDSSEARRLRRTASWIGRLNLLLALSIVALGVMLVRGLP